MTNDSPIRIDSFHAEARRVRSGLLQRQYRLSSMLALVLLAASCAIVATAGQAGASRTPAGVVTAAQR